MASPQRKSYALKIKNFGPQTIHTTPTLFSSHTLNFNLPHSISPPTFHRRFCLCSLPLSGTESATVALSCRGLHTLSVAGREFKVTKEPLAAEIIPAHAL